MLAVFLLRFPHSYRETDLIFSVDFLASFWSSLFIVSFLLKCHDVKVKTICKVCEYFWHQTKNTSFLDHIHVCMHIKRSWISFLIDCTFQSSFRFTTKLKGTKISHIALTPIYAQRPPISTSFVRAVHLLTTDEHVLMPHYQSKSLVDIRAHFECCICMGFDKCVMTYIHNYGTIQNSFRISFLLKFLHNFCFSRPLQPVPKPSSI